MAKFNLEANLTKLDELVNAMEGGNLPLDQSLKAFEGGIKLIRECQKHLSDAEQKVKILTENSVNAELADFNDD